MLNIWESRNIVPNHLVAAMRRQIASESGDDEAGDVDELFRTVAAESMRPDPAGLQSSLDQFYADAGVNSRREARRSRSPSPRRDRPVRERSRSPGRSVSPPMPGNGPAAAHEQHLGLGAYDATPDPFEQFRKQRSEQQRQRLMEHGN